MPVWDPISRMHCVDYYTRELSRCYNYCGESNTDCVLSCGGNPECINQCSANTSFCNQRCRFDFDERKHSVCHVWP